MLAEFTRRLRELLSNAPDNKQTTYFDFFDLLDSCILEISSSDADSQQRVDFEEELQVVFDEEVRHSDLSHVELFLEVLLHARPVLNSGTLISTWFDLLLRPALREPKLSEGALDACEAGKLALLEFWATYAILVDAIH